MNIIRKIAGTAEFIGFITGFSAVGKIEQNAPLMPWIVVLIVGMAILGTGAFINAKLEK